MAQSLFYIGAGVNHFLHEDFYTHLMPDHYDDPRAWVLITGAAEILGGLGLLIPQSRRFSAVALAAMLAGYMDVHLYMLRHPERFPEFPQWGLEARIPMQVLLIAWALAHARPEPPSADRAD